MEELGSLIKIIVAAIIMAVIVILLYGSLADMAYTSGVATPTKEPPKKLLEPTKRPHW